MLIFFYLFHLKFKVFFIIILFYFILIKEGVQVVFSFKLYHVFTLKNF